MAHTTTLNGLLLNRTLVPGVLPTDIHTPLAFPASFEDITWKLKAYIKSPKKILLTIVCAIRVCKPGLHTRIAHIVQVKKKYAALPAPSKAAWRNPEESRDILGGNLQTPGAA
jgi:hypothetical protein